VFEPYEPKGKVPAEFRDLDGFYVKHFATTMAMVINTKRLAEKNLPKPLAWEDLIKPIYKDEIALPSPIKSGTGMSILTTFVDAFGWNFVENLHANVRQYSDGGSGGAQMAAKGEVVIGLTFDTTAFGMKSTEGPIDVVYARITPNVMEGGGLVAGAKNAKEAKLFLDFMVSEEAARVLAPLVGATLHPGLGLIDLKSVSLWEMRRPVDATAFRREFQDRFLKQ
jgi:iron(III) transport system substrate-binding protein